MLDRPRQLPHCSHTAFGTLHGSPMLQLVGKRIYEWFNTAIVQLVDNS